MGFTNSITNHNGRAFKRAHTGPDVLSRPFTVRSMITITFIKVTVKGQLGGPRHNVILGLV